MHMHYANCVIRATCLEVKQRREQTRLVGVKSEFDVRLWRAKQQKFNLMRFRLDIG